MGLPSGSLLLAGGWDNWGRLSAIWLLENDIWKKIGRRMLCPECPECPECPRHFSKKQIEKVKTTILLEISRDYCYNLK